MNTIVMKQLKNIARYVLALSLVLFCVTSCEDFLDINTSPNSPTESRLDLVLPSVQSVIFESLGNGNASVGDLASQFVHHTTQRGESNFYFVAGNEFSISNAWDNLYAGALKDIEDMIAQATELNSPHYLGVAQVLKAYAYSMMVDVWGMAAFSEFGQGTQNPFASFDDGADIYPQLFVLLDEAVINFAKESPVEIEAEDLVYGGDVERWTKFANSLKLKLYNQVRLTGLYDAAAVTALMNGPLLMEEVDDGFRLRYTDSNNPENRHPLFLQDYVNAKGTTYIDPYFYLIMSGSFPNGTVLNDVLLDDGGIGFGDPRIPYYFFNQLAGDDPQNPTTSAYWGDFLSIWFASFNIDPNEGFDQGDSQTLLGLYPAGGAFDDGEGGAGDADSGLKGAGYTRLYPYYAHLFTMAELVHAGGGDARDLFEQGMVASFDEVNDIADLAGVPVINDTLLYNPDADQWDGYIDQVMALYDAASPQEKLELIMTQKWIASFGASVDSWTDYRRTGYPLMFDPATDNNPVTILNRNYPVSLPYFIDDLQINPNAPAQRNPGSDKVFWDVN
jgi:hypothetical protein